MEQVEYFGALIMPRAKALACAAAMKVDGSHFLNGRENHDGLSHDDLRHITSHFIPSGVEKPLSGLWHRMCGEVEYGAREYMDPSCRVRITDWGLLIGSVRGDVEAAAHIISHLVSGSDWASLWWSGIGDPSFWGAIHLFAEGRESIVSEDQQDVEGVSEQASMQEQFIVPDGWFRNLVLKLGAIRP